MTFWFHSTILATSLAATVAVGLASAAIYADTAAEVAAKADRLPVAGTTTETTYLIFETRNDGTSVMTRIPVTGPVAELN
jgi:hypothetical protein